MTLDEAINQFEYQRKKVLTEYRILELNKDFQEIRIQDESIYRLIHLYDYVVKNIIPFINKEEYSKLTYYVNNNMLLEDIPEFKCYNRKQLDILKHLAMFNVDEYVQI